MMNKKSILVIPGAFQFVKNYGNYEGMDIWLKSNLKEKIPTSNYIIAHSAGAIFALTLSDHFQGRRFILINPPIKKRNILNLFLRWIKFLVLEGIKTEKVVPITNWIYGLKKLFKLLKIDTLEIIKKIPGDNLVIIRGKKDDFFCDKESAEVIKNNNINLIETDAGHDWNEKIAEVVANLISN